MTSNQLTTQSSLLSGNGKKDPVLSEEQREALNTALSGAFSSMNSVSLEGKGKSKDAEGDTGVKGGLRGVPPPLERKAGGVAKKGHGSHSQGGGHASKAYHDHHLSRKNKGSGKAKKGGAGGACDVSSEITRDAA